MADRHADLIAALRAAGHDLDLPDRDPTAVALTRIRTEGRTAAPSPADPGRAGRSRRAGRRWLGLAPAAGAPPGLAAPPARARWVALAAAAAVVLAVVLAVPGARQAVARLLGIGGVRVTVTGDPPGDLGRALDLGDPLPVDEAVAAAGGAFDTPFPSPPGDPALAFAGRPDGAVSLVWPAGEGLPALEESEVGLILTVFPTDGAVPSGDPGDPDDPGGPLVEKQAGPGTRVTAVQVGPHHGYWLSGAPHEVRDGPAGGGGPPAAGAGARLAGNTLIWADGATTYRLESGLERAPAIALAEALTGATG